MAGLLEQRDATIETQAASNAQLAQAMRDAVDEANRRGGRIAELEAAVAVVPPIILSLLSCDKCNTCLRHETAMRAALSPDPQQIDHETLQQDIDRGLTAYREAHPRRRDPQEVPRGNE